MNPVNSRILVKVNMTQKHTMLIGGVLFSTATKFDSNYRERSPTIAEVVEGNKILKTGDIIVCHHNHFYSPSPYQLEDDIFSIPYNKTIFATVNKSGKLSSVCGNILGERVEKKPLFPAEHSTYIDRLLITDKGWTSYKNGSVVMCRPNAPYDIVWNWKGEERRITKLDSEQIIGILINNKK